MIHTNNIIGVYVLQIV